MSKQNELNTVVDKEEEEYNTELSEKDKNDWVSGQRIKNYLELAKMDYMLVQNSKDSLADCCEAVTSSIALAFEKALSHLLMLKEVQFTPTHKCVYLLNKVLEVYEDFPKQINHVDCTLCTVWYHTNRYPQGNACGYVNYYLILAMITDLELLLDYCEKKSEEYKDAELNFEKYKMTMKLSDAPRVK